MSERGSGTGGSNTNTQTNNQANNQAATNTATGGSVGNVSATNGGNTNTNTANPTNTFTPDNSNTFTPNNSNTANPMNTFNPANTNTAQGGTGGQGGAGGTATVFVLGTILMRSAGCAINDWADREFDGAVKRTAMRPLAAGEISGREALWVGAACALAAALLLIPLNWPARFWALPALAIAAVYPFTKRFFSIPQAILGIAFSMGIPMAFAAVQGEAPLIAAWLMLANFFWVLAFDTGPFERGRVTPQSFP